MSEVFPSEITGEPGAGAWAAPARRSRPTLGLLMLAVVAVAVPAAVAGNFLRENRFNAEVVWWLGIWGLGILLIAVAIGAWWWHSAAQVLLQVILVTGLFGLLISLGGILPDDDLIPHVAVVVAFAVTVTIPLVLRRRAVERHPPGPARDRLLGIAAVGLAAGLNLAVQIAYMILFTFLLR